MQSCLSIYYFFYSVFLSFSMSQDSFLNPLDNFNNWKTKWLPRTAWRRQTDISQSLCWAEGTGFSIPVWLGLPAGQKAGTYLLAIQHVLGAASALARVASQRSCRAVVWGAGEYWEVSNDWEKFRIWKGVLRCGGVKTVRRRPVKNIALHTNCSFPEGNKILLLLNKRMKLFFKDVQRPLRFHHFSRSSPLSWSDVKEWNPHCTNSQNSSIFISEESVRKGW